MGKCVRVYVCVCVCVLEGGERGEREVMDCVCVFVCVRACVSV